MKFHGSHPWLFTGFSTILLLAAFFLSVLRHGTRAGRIVFLAMSALVVGVNFWPDPPAPSGWITVALSTFLALWTFYVLLRPTERRESASGDVASSRVLLHVIGMT